MGDRSASQPTPPVTLRIGRYERANLVPVIHVEALYTDVIGVAISRLNFVGIEASREEEHWLTSGCNLDIVDIGGNAGCTCECPQRRGFEQRKIAVAPAHLDHWLNLQRVAIVVDNHTVVDGLDLKLVVGVDEVTAIVVESGATRNHR